MRRRLGLVTLLAAVSCATPARVPPGDLQQPVELPHRNDGLPAFIENDYPRALKLAKASRRPLFIETWASWCGACVAMRRYVFTDPALARFADQFVWLSIDTEDARNTEFLEQFPLEVWPTLLLVEPEEAVVALKWSGSATIAQLERVLADGERAVRDQAPGELEQRLVRADRLYGSGRVSAAVDGYREVLEVAPAGWASRARAAESLALALFAHRDYEECAAAAREHAPRVARGPAFTNLVATGLGCAVAASESDRWRAGALAALEPLGTEGLTSPGLLPADTSMLYEQLASAAHARKDEQGEKNIAARWLAFTTEAWSKAATPLERAWFAPNLASAALRAGEPARALAALEAAEHDLPDDDYAAMRLATVHLALGQLGEALAAANRALARLHGPRRLRVLELKATALARKGDVGAARGALEEALAFADQLPPAQRSFSAVQRVKQLLSNLPEQRR